MHTLAGRTVLLVEDDQDSRELLADGLRHKGAVVESTETAEQALAVLAHRRPDVLISDLDLPGIDGVQLLYQVRLRPELRDLPAIALTGHAGESHRTAAFVAGFSKHLLKPVKVGELATAILAVAGRPALVTAEPPGDVREALERLGQVSPCRFTALLQFSEDDTLQSVWTFDRENPQADPFPLALPIRSSYCVLVRAQGETCVVEDAPNDPRTVGHTKRTELATYMGVPVFRPDGKMIGTVCSFDARPISFDATVRVAVERATREIEQLLWAMGSA